MTTYGDWFSGFGGMTIGAKEAGLDVLFGAEIDPQIADVYRQNLGDHILVCNLLETPVTAFPRVDVFHASPPCPNFSVAKAGSEETEQDIALARKVAEYIVYHLPDIFTLENVYQYRNSRSWLTIAQALHNHGYLFNYWHVNMADYGVPQTRQRMIVIARRDGVMPQLPPATHAEAPQPGLFGTMPRWVSWYEAIEDLIPTLPDSEFRPWHIPRIPNDCDDFLILTGNKNLADAYPGRGCSLKNEPSNTVVAGSGGKDGVAAIRVNGKCKRLSLRSYARLQSFPDWYKIPEKTSKGIGNAVPPLFAEKLYRHLVPDMVKA